MRGAKGRYAETDLVVNKQVGSTPTLTDKNGIVHVATFFDANLVNPWGISESATSPFWVSDNGSGVSTLYNTPGQPQSLVVAIPSPADPLGAGGTPTGQAFNPAGAQNAFLISGVNAGGVQTTLPAVFLFATEDGTILGWNPGVLPPGAPSAPPPSTNAIIAVDNSTSGAVYKGLAVAQDLNGAIFLFVTNFHGGTIEVYDSLFEAVNLSPRAFRDPDLPRGYAPFNVVPISRDGVTELVVTYAKQDANRKDDVAGEGHGIVNIFDLNGHLRRHFARHGRLDSPWGVALAPEGFGEFGGALLIGNFGNGQINAFDPEHGEFVGRLRRPDGRRPVIDGLWALLFGNGGNGGDKNTLYFTAGPNDEADGIFGSIAPQD
jgi:uncharacterized protein (TIGR03118 family)